MVNLINGHFRTPKLEALDRLITWLNIRALGYLSKVHGRAIPELAHQKLDQSPLLENNWLAGFTDADGCFATDVGKRKGQFYNVVCLFIIELRQTYHRPDLTGVYPTSY